MTRAFSPGALSVTAKFVAAYDSLARSELERRAATTVQAEASDVPP
jgi:hypothetical protein